MSRPQFPVHLVVCAPSKVTTLPGFVFRRRPTSWVGGSPSGDGVQGSSPKTYLRELDSRTTLTRPPTCGGPGLRPTPPVIGTLQAAISDNSPDFLVCVLKSDLDCGVGGRLGEGVQAGQGHRKSGFRPERPGLGRGDKYSWGHVDPRCEDFVP